MSRIQELIAKQRAKLDEAVEHTLPVDVDGEEVVLGFRKVLPNVWDDLVGRSPARKNRDDDAQMGYNPKALSRAYPKVTVDGEQVSAAEWSEFFDVLDPVYRNHVELTIWGININDTLLAMRELGKARAGQKSPSPAN